MVRIGLVILVLAAALLGGCPQSSEPTTGDPNDPNSVSDPNAAAWLNGNWMAVAVSTGESTTGCLTIATGRVAVWGHGCAGEKMAILDAPAATVTGDNAVVTVTVVPTDGGLMTVTMRLKRNTDDALSGSITTVSFGSSPFLGTVTLTRR